MKISKTPPLLLALIATLILTAPHPCPAWNSTGHEIVAQIALDQLPVTVKNVLFNILRQHPRYQEDLLHDLVPGQSPDLAAFLRAATWPDMVRYQTNPLRQTENHPRWHYVDYPIDTHPFDYDGVAGPDPVELWDGKSDPENLLQAMQKVCAELKDPKTPAPRKAIDLCWVEHLVGDIHQPLHAASYFSPELPKGDQGGNLMIIQSQPGVNQNLHSFWDGLEGLSMDPVMIRGIADRIEANHPPAEFKSQVVNLNVVSWAKESYDLAQSNVYLHGSLPHAVRSQSRGDPKDVPPTTTLYVAQAELLADQRIALAGYRLATLLKELTKFI